MSTILEASQAPLLRTRDVAMLLQCSPSFVRTLAQRGSIPSVVEIGGRTFRPEDVSAFVEQREQQDRDLITFNEAAHLLGYSNASSVTHLIERGVLKAQPYRKAAKRVLRTDVEALAATKGAPVRRRPKGTGNEV